MNKAARLPGLSSRHINLLRAAVCDGDAATGAWHLWRARTSIDRADTGSAQLFPLVYRNLRAQGIAEDDLPALLKGTCRHTWARTQPLLDAGIRAARALEAEGIEPLFIKGAAMILDGYPHADVRPMNDIDIVVPAASALKAIAALRASGWSPRLPEPERLVAVRHSAEFVDVAGRRLDLHWHFLLERCSEEADEALRRDTRTVPRDGASLRLASRSARLACVYGPATPANPPLRWLADLCALAKGGVNWTDIAAMARRLRLAQEIHAALHVAASDLALSLPAGLLDELRAQPASRSDRFEHAMAARTRPVLGCLPSLWFSYRRAATDHVSFPRYVQYHFSLPGLSRLPGFIVKAGARRLARGHR